MTSNAVALEFPFIEIKGLSLKPVTARKMPPGHKVRSIETWFATGNLEALKCLKQSVLNQRPQPHLTSVGLTGKPTVP